MHLPRTQIADAITLHVRVALRWMRLTGCVSLWVFAASVMADAYDDGRNAFDAGRYEESLSHWVPLADDGDARAQFGLGSMYFDGLGVEKDLARSFEWFLSAANQGFPPAQFNLGNAYKHGRGVERSDSKANEWWRRAAQQEFAPAQFNLATQYYFGHGVAKDERTAIEWYRRAADNGHARAIKLFRKTGEDESAKLEPGVSSDQPVVTSGGLGWLLDESADHFTLQLLATTNQAAARQFLEQSGLQAETAIIEFSRDGTPWYALIHGVYADRAAATKAAEALPAKLRQTPAWIRRIGDVQQIIQR